MMDLWLPYGFSEKEGGREMFPLMHYHIAKNIVAGDPSIIALASVLPDLCVNMGLERSFGHTQGKAFYDWVLASGKHFSSDGKALALAFASHGTYPWGLDYYSDEVWPGGERGFCFQCAGKYQKEVVAACAIPKNWAAWKGHNLVEMAFEADIAILTPELCRQMINAAKDREAANFIGEVFGGFAHISPALVGDTLRKIPVIFGIEQGAPLELAEKYCIQLEKRHQIVTAEAEEIAALIEKIRVEEKDAMADFNQRVFPLIAQNLAQMVQEATENNEPKNNEPKNNESKNNESKR